MDGNKKIAGFVFAGIIALAINACKVQPSGYVSLYVDNLISVTDTTESGVAPLKMTDTARAHVVDTKAVVETEFPVFLQPIEQEVRPLDSPYTKVEFMQLIQVKNDTIVTLRKQLNELKNSGFIKTDTVYVIRETVESPLAESHRNDRLTLQLLRAKDEQISKLQNQLNALQNAAARTPQPTHIIRETEQVQPLIIQQTDQLSLQLFQSQSDTIQFLRSQLRNLQTQSHNRDSVSIENEAKEHQPHIIDSAYIENEVKELQFEKELNEKQKVTDLQALQDTISLLKNHVLSLEEQILQGKDTTTLARQGERDILYKTIKDTTMLMVAFYERGEIKPLEEENILQQIEELCRNKNVTKITLSGYTDSSGSEIINKEITNRRLNYLSEMIIPWIAKDKIFFQNFGDIFASVMVVSEERRIEIIIHIK